MIEFTIGEHVFRIEAMSPKRAFHIGRRLLPVLGGLAGFASKDVDLSDLETLGEALKPLGGVLAEMSDEQADYVIDACLASVKLQLPGGGGWAPIQTGGALMYDWIDPTLMIQLVFRVVQQNLGFLALAGAQAEGAK